MKARGFRGLGGTAAAIVGSTERGLGSRRCASQRSAASGTAPVPPAFFER